MFQHVVRRLMLLVVALLILSVVSFALIELWSLSALEHWLNKMQEGLTPEGEKELLQLIKPLYGLDYPFYVKYLKMLPCFISGTMIVSIVLGISTIGMLFHQALLNYDGYLMGDSFLVLNGVTMVGVFLLDILSAWLDPRLRLANSDVPANSRTLGQA